MAEYQELTTLHCQRFAAYCPLLTAYSSARPRDTHLLIGVIGGCKRLDEAIVNRAG